MTTKLQKEILGHVYLVAGGREKVAAVSDFLKKAGIEMDLNPDVYVREYLSFGIDDARELRERACLRAITHRQTNTRAMAGARRVFIIVTPSMTSDAQNALLKTLEEPPAGAVFFFVVASPETLLSTLRSRSHILSLPTGAMPRPGLGIETVGLDVKKFLTAALAKRIDMVKQLYVREDDEERDVRGAVAFLSELERTLSAKVNDEKVREGIRAIYLAQKHLMDKGSLLKPLLEQLALLVPKA